MITRRQFISIAVVGTTAASGIYLGYPVIRQSVATHWRLLTGDALTNYALQLDGVSAIGKRYLSTLTAEDADREKLYKLVAEKIGYHESMKAKQISLHVFSRIQQEFIDGDSCLIDGWNLSMLECQLAGLYVLSGGESEPVQVKSDRQLIATAKHGTIVEIEGWGPKETGYKENFNVLPDGHSALWFIAKRSPRGIQVCIDGWPIRTHIDDTVITCSIPTSMLEKLVSRVGKHTIMLYEKVTNTKQTVGYFVVHGPADQLVCPDDGISNIFCRMEKWTRVLFNIDI